LTFVFPFCLVLVANLEVSSGKLWQLHLQRSSVVVLRPMGHMSWYPVSQYPVLVSGMVLYANCYQYYC
jgi:hypothetical protein